MIFIRLKFQLIRFSMLFTIVLTLLCTGCLQRPSAFKTTDTTETSLVKWPHEGSDLSPANSIEAEATANG
ncbi:MAG: hypothetical protein JJV91_01400, partial [Desulfosarcina sp.]|nr:hypothetical protein [Desulfobacterales bacterium]